MLGLLLWTVICQLYKMKGQERMREGHKHVEVGKHRNWLEGNQRYNAEEGSKASFRKEMRCEEL